MSRPSVRGMSVLVTGADGFIGSHLAEALARAGAHVRAFCFYNSNGSLGWLDRAADDVRAALDVRLGDIRDSRFVDDACQGVDVAFHLAALIAIPYSYIAPQSFVDTNVHGTLNVLEAVRRNGVSRLIHTSTSEVYGTPETLPITEKHPLKGQSPYSATKIAADKLCEAFCLSYNTPVVVLRPFNTFGPRQSARAVLPTILTQLLAGERLVRVGNLEPRRDWTFVDDTVSAFIAAATAHGIDGEVIQLGTGCTWSIRQALELACRVVGVDAEPLVEDERIRPEHSEVMALQSDPSLAQSLLGWRAETSFEEGLARTAEWLQSNLDHFRPEVYAV